MSRPKTKRPLCTTVNVRSVPVQLRNSFKAWCSLRGVSMQEKIISLIRETVKSSVFTEGKP